MEYEINRYMPKDYEFVYQTKKNVYMKYVEINWGSWNELDQREMFDNFINSYGKDIQIIIVKNQMVGFFHGNDLPDGNYELGNICIAPNFQGKGLGTKVLKDIIAKHKHQDIYLRYFKQNPVVHLYKRLGFEMVEELPYHYKMCLKSKNKNLKR